MLELEGSGKIFHSFHLVSTVPQGVSHLGVGAEPWLPGVARGGRQGGRQGASAWQRAGCAPALEAMPAEGLGELNRLHIHSIAS